MKKIEGHELAQLTKHTGLFFTQEGIMIDPDTASPLISVEKALTISNLTIHTVYLDATILIVQCDLSSHSEFRVIPIRTALAEAASTMQHQILRAQHWLNWNATYQHCSKCGNKLEKLSELNEKKCTVCDAFFYPSLSPAIMVLIQREDEVLLARSPHFRPGIYSAIAGFVDLAETAEAAAHRETKEELNIEITQLEYFGTQSWPFPHSFMIAFKAHYLSGELQIDKNEIEDARWFNIHHLPLIPSTPSIARRLIESVELT